MSKSTEVRHLDKWDLRFMQMARLVATWSSCYQPGRAIGAVIVKDKRVMTTGYNGAPAGMRTCKERGFCLRRQLNIPSGTHTEVCYAIHAEQNAVIQAAKLGVSIEGGTLYCTHQPCSVCARIMVNAGIRRVVYEQGYPDAFALEFFRETGVALERWEEPLQATGELAL
jgi:dCMP deaminase